MTFDTPQQFMAWVAMQSKDIQESIAITVDALIAAGLTGQEAAHATYDLVEAIRSLDNGKSPRAFNPNMN